jgi:spermidine synthase
LVCSGTAALGYEIVWTRLCTPMLGSETLGVLATLAGFFGGMALGAAVWHRRAVSGADPIGLFVRLELVAAAFAIVSPYLFHALGRAIPAALGPVAGANDTPASVAIAIAIAAVLMLPGTLCMGATLAAVTEARRRVCKDDDGRGIGRLYAANTAGAVVGVLATVHIVIPMAGLGFGAAIIAAFGGLAAWLAHDWGRRVVVPREPSPVDATPVDASLDPDPEVHEPIPLLVLLGGAGIVGVGLEVIGVLVLSQVFENTIYTFANILAVWLAGTAAGAWLWGARGPKWSHRRPATTAAVLLLVLAVSIVLAAVFVANAPAILESIAPSGASFGAHQLAELAVAACVFAVPTVLMGALFSHGMGLVAPGGIGRAYAINTAGGAIAPFLFGVWAPAALGYRDAFYFVAYGYLVVFGAFTWFRRFKPAVQIGAILGVVAITALGPRDLVIADPEAGWTTIAEHQSAMGLVIVSERADTAASKLPLRRLQIGEHFRMGGAMSFGERRMGHLPLLLAPDSRRALFLGVGTGATLGAVRSFPTLESIDAVELVPAVLAELHEFASINADVHDDPRVSFHAADARRFVAASHDTYDLIVADLFHPGLDGAGSLYAREHFENVAARLAPGGLFAQWLPLYQLDEETLPTMACTFAAVFPEAHAFLGIYNVQTPAIALVARAGAPLTIDVAALEATLQAPIYRELLMQDSRDMLGAHLLDPAGIATLCGDAPINTDMRPYVTLRAPRVAYEGMASHGMSNLARVLALRVALSGDALVVDDARRGVMEADIDRFGRALALYLDGEIHREAAGTKLSMDAIDRYLEAFVVAPEFVPARGMLLMAAGRNAEVAERVLPQMVAAAPDDARVSQAWIAYLERIGDTTRLEQARASAGSTAPPE